MFFLAASRNVLQNDAKLKELLSAGEFRSLMNDEITL